MRRNIPDEARRAIEEAQSLEELRDKLDLAVTELEVIKAERVDREIETLGKDELKEQERVGRGLVSGRAKEMALRKIQQIRKRITSYERQSSILQQKIDSNLGILNRIQEMALMEHGNVLTVDQIDELAVKYGDVKERHERYVEAEHALSGEVEGVIDDVRAQKELAALEAEIMKEFTARETEDEELARKEQERLAAEKAFEEAAEQSKPVEEQLLEEEEKELEEEPETETATKEPPIKIRRRPTMEEVLESDASEPTVEEKTKEKEERQLETE